MVGLLEGEQGTTREGEEKLVLWQAMGSIWMTGGVVTRLGAAEDGLDAVMIDSEVLGLDA